MKEKNSSQSALTSVAAQIQKTLPQSIEAEQAVLGAMLLDPEAVVKALELVSESDFYLQSHRQIFRAITNLFERNVQVDLLTTAEELSRMKELDNVGGKEYLSTLIDMTVTTAHIEEHCKLVLEKSIQRKLIQTATQIITESYDPTQPTDELLDRAEHLIFQIKERGIRKGLVEIKEVFNPIIKKLEERYSKRTRSAMGYETGFDKLDEMTNGLQPGDFIVIAGRPAMGKTAFALNIGLNVADHYKQPVAIFSLEMTTETLIERIICAKSRIPFNTLRKGFLLSDADWRNLTNISSSLKQLPIYIDDSPSPRILEIKAKARRLKAEVGLALIIIDYIQLCQPIGPPSSQRNRQQEISDISRALKALAKELNVPVIALSQLSRLPERREDRRPQLADLRESGAIEQDADLVLLLYRSEVYADFIKNIEPGVAEIIIAKQRNGPTGTIKLSFLKETMRFEKLTKEEVPEPIIGEE
ncbi:MAG: replicative DNA helicase [candidate division WOR-3 bacterium]|nr:replicative DNA helicase [candidate division WOR-3 bacterium]